MKRVLEPVVFLETNMLHIMLSMLGGLTIVIAGLVCIVFGALGSSSVVYLAGYCISAAGFGFMYYIFAFDVVHATAPPLTVYTAITILSVISTIALHMAIFKREKSDTLK